MSAKQLSSSGVLYTDRRKFNLDNDQLAELYPSAVPFTMFALQGRESAQTTDPDFKHN